VHGGTDADGVVRLLALVAAAEEWSERQERAEDQLSE
jgi:hypothetical protein